MDAKDVMLSKVEACARQVSFLNISQPYFSG